MYAVRDFDVLSDAVIQNMKNRVAIRLTADSVTRNICHDTKSIMLILPCRITLHYENVKWYKLVEVKTEHFKSRAFKLARDQRR